MKYITIAVFVMLVGICTASADWSLAAGKYGSAGTIQELIVWNNNIYAGTAGAADGGLLLKYNSSGNQWDLAASQLNGQDYIYDLVIYDSNIYAGTRDNGAPTLGGRLFMFDEPNSTWVQKAGNLNSQEVIVTLHEFNNSLWGGTAHGARLFKWNGVDAWTQMAGQYGSEAEIYRLFDYNNTLYASTASGGLILKWSETTNSWSQQCPQLNGQSHIATGVWRDGVYYAGTFVTARLFNWIEGNSTWTQDAPQFGSETHIYTCIEYDGDIYGGTNPNGKLLKWDNVSTWTEVATQYSSETWIADLIVFNNEIYGSTYPNGMLLRYTPPYTPDTGSYTYAKKKSIPVYNANTTYSLTNYSISINVTWESGMNSDFTDIIAKNENTGVWLEGCIDRKSDGNWADFWFKADTVASGWNNATFYLYFDSASPKGHVCSRDRTFKEHNTFETNLEGFDYGTQDNTYAYDGSYSYLPPTNPTLAVKTTKTGETEPQIVEYMYYLPSGESGNDILYSYYGFDSASKSLTSGLGAINSLEWSYYQTYPSSAWIDTGVVPSTATWHTMSYAHLPNGTYAILHNGTIEGSGFYRNELQDTHLKLTKFSGKLIYIDNIRTRKWNTEPPSVGALGATEGYIDSVHYNSTQPYNLTIDSNGNIASNRSIIATDDLNWTAQAASDDCGFIVTEFNLSNTTVANFTIYTANLDWLQVTNLTVGAEYNLTNGTTYEHHTADASGEANFTTDLAPGDYQIVVSEIIISLISFTPDALHQNYTGYTNISFGIKHSSGAALNLSSLAFLFGINYTEENNYNNSLRVPSNEICENLNGHGKILRSNYRNVSPYLSWEYNDTITEGNIYKWGGADNDTEWIIKNKINDTFTYINISTATMQIFPNMMYLGQRVMYEAPKTQFAISRAHSLITKWWDLETINGRDRNFTYSGFFDTGLDLTQLPNADIEIWWGNNSFNPLTDDFRTSPYCGHLETWNYTRWNTHIHTPHENASYCAPLVVNASLYTDPLPDTTNYLIFASDTVSSKPYLLNVTNYDPGITNITFAQTDTCWDYNELAQVADAYAYTPSCFYTFNRKYERLEYHLYIADNQSTWVHSDIYHKDIGTPNYPPTIPEIHHFRIYCPFCGDWVNDSYMDATYNDGYMYINVQTGHDPDGGATTHNLTLHYSNGTYIATINNSFPSGDIVDINFSSSGYYSQTDAFTLKVVATDDEGLTSEKWLGKDFALDADGSQGVVLDDIVRFWGYHDLPTLHAAIANESILSHDVGNDIYTMRYPFFKSKLNDSFTINHTLHLKSINQDNVSYYRYRGHTDIIDTSIHAWNTITDTAAPTTDDYRAYIVSFTNAVTNITDSEVSNLGIDEYRQEGLNYVQLHSITVDNSTLAYNDRGIIFEYCDAPTIINSSVNNNVQVGIGVYYTNNSNITNNKVENNGRTGIRLYGSYNNQIIDNTIDNSGYHGTWCQFSENNTYRENGVKNMAAGYYDYYFSSSSIDNQIIDSASSANRIRCTSTSAVKIENTDNQVFGHNSINFNSTAYPNNFSMFMSGTGETIDINQHNFWITPNGSSLNVSDVSFNAEISVKTDSDINISIVWFNMSKSDWRNEVVNVDRDDVSYDSVYASNIGFVSYKYEGGYSAHTFRFYIFVPELIFQMFVLMILFAVGTMLYSFMVIDPDNYTHVLAAFLSGVVYILSGLSLFDGIGFYGDDVLLAIDQTGWVAMVFILLGAIMVLYACVLGLDTAKEVIEELEEST